MKKTKRRVGHPRITLTKSWAKKNGKINDDDDLSSVAVHRSVLFLFGHQLRLCAVCRIVCTRSSRYCTRSGCCQAAINIIRANSTFHFFTPSHCGSLHHLLCCWIVVWSWLDLCCVPLVDNSCVWCRHFGRVCSFLSLAPCGTFILLPDILVSHEGDEVNADVIEDKYTSAPGSSQFQFVVMCSTLPCCHLFKWKLIQKSNKISNWAIK